MNATDQRVDLMLDRGLAVDEDRLERLIQALLFYADRVHLRASARVDLSPVARRRVADLVHMGAVKTWAYEYEVTSGGRVKGPFVKDPLAVEADSVITIETAKELVADIGDELSLSEKVLQEAAVGLREGVSEVVQLRHGLLALRLADSVGAVGLLTTSSGRGSLTDAVTASVMPSVGTEAVVSTIVDQCRFGALADLPIQALVDCRKHVPAFRSYLEGRSRNSAEDMAAEILDEYRAVASSRARHPALGAGQSVWTAIGGALPATVLTRALRRRINWFKNHRNEGPLLLLSTLDSYAP
jgi:hypothetical protein